VHPKVPAGFGGRLRGKGPQQRDLAAQPILLVRVLAEDGGGMPLVDDEDSVEELAADGADEPFGDRVGPRLDSVVAAGAAAAERAAAG